MSYPTNISASDVWSIRDVYKARAGDSWPELSTGTNGSLYADSYLATTGGSLITVTSSGSINSVIDSANDGDAILLAPGTYNTIPNNSITNVGDGFRVKNILIVGDSNDPADVVVEHNPDGDAGQRDHPVFNGLGYTSINTNKQIAFCTYRRNADSYLGTNYSNSLVRNFEENKGIAVNVYFDLDNEGVSWHYDNTGSSNNDVRFIRCTFANYSTWQSSYSGRDDQIDVEDCLFSGSTDSTEYVDLGGNVTNATIDETNRTYNTGTYSSSGHLYVPNTNAVAPTLPGIIIDSSLFLFLDPSNPNSFSGGTTATNLQTGGLVTGANGTPGSGSHTADSSNFPSYNSINGGVFDFDGGKGMNFEEDLGTRTELTFTIWFYKKGTGTDYFSDARNDGGQWFLSNYQSRNINYTSALAYNFNGPTTGDYLADGPNFDNRWYHMTVVSDVNGSKLYLNGAEVNQYVSNNSINTTFGKNFRIGTRYTTSSQWTGYMGSIYAYDRILSSAEIESNFNAERDRYGI